MQDSLGLLLTQNPWRTAVIAVTMMFATVAAVIAWGDKQTRANSLLGEDIVEPLTSGLV